MYYTEGMIKDKSNDITHLDTSSYAEASKQKFLRNHILPKGKGL